MSTEGAKTHLEYNRLTKLPVTTATSAAMHLPNQSTAEDTAEEQSEQPAVTTFVPSVNTTDLEGGDDSYDMITKDDETNMSIQTEDEGQRQESEGLIRVNNSLPPSASQSRAVSVSHRSAFSPSALLSSSWPQLPPRAAKLQRRRRGILIRLLKTWEGREQVLQLSHSLVLLLHSSLHFPTPKTYLQGMLRPGGVLLTSTFPRQLRSVTMQRIYTVGEGIDSFRRLILIARWITNGTQAVMDHFARQNLMHSKHFKKQREEAQAALTGEEPIHSPSDCDPNAEKFPWLQPQSAATLDVVKSDKLNKYNGDTTTSTWRQMWTLPTLEFVSETLGTMAEACEVGAFLAGGGLFWRAVGLERLFKLTDAATRSSSSYSRIATVLMLSRRRRRGIERLGIVFSLCSIVLSLLTLRWRRRELRMDVRSAHRRILRANDKIGWASHLAGTQVPFDTALSHRRQDPAQIARQSTKDPLPSGTPRLENLGMDISRAAQDLDDDDDTYSDESVEHHHRSLSPGPLLKSSERSLVRAESDLRTARRGLRSNSWLSLAAWSDTLFIVYETLAPSVQKEGVEAWSGLLASTLRLSELWSSLTPSRNGTL